MFAFLEVDDIMIELAYIRKLKNH